jgi:pimeloyl-ACP methyl ester carboxylesterase
LEEVTSVDTPQSDRIPIECVVRFVFADIAGVPTRYLIAGQGPAVMLLHGVGLSADSWLWTAPALAHQHTVVAPDLLDNGFTAAGSYQGGPPQPYTVDHLIGLADHLGFRQFSLVGSSLGAAMALLTYLKIPDRIAKIVLVGPSLVLAPPREGFDMFEGPYRNGLGALQTPTYESCRSRMGRGFFDEKRVPEALIAIQMILHALPGALQSFERRMAGLRSPAATKYALHDKLESIKAPVLVLGGEEDIRGSFSDVAKDAVRLPNAQFRLYERCGHWPHLEYPDIFNRDVLDFLNR